MVHLKDALLARIDAQRPNTPPPDFDTLVGAVAQRRTQRRRLGLAAVGVAVVAVTMTAVMPSVVHDPSNDRPSTGGAASDSSSATADNASENAPAGREGAVPMRGTFGCVDTYTASAVADADMAFSGTVRSIRPLENVEPGATTGDTLAVSFTVDHWYRGKAGEEVTIALFPPDGSSYAEGSRLLVSGGAGSIAPGVAGVGWSCGFTRYWDRTTADAWEDATAAK